MIPGDEGKPMSILERISDEPVDCEPFLEYCLRDYRGHLAYWAALPNDRDPGKPTARDCVCAQLESFISRLDDALMKLRRERQREASPIAQIRHASVGFRCSCPDCNPPSTR